MMESRWGEEAEVGGGEAGGGGERGGGEEKGRR